MLLTLYTLTSVCIFSILFSIHFQRGWQGEFVQQSRAALVGDHLLHSHNFHFLYSRDLNVWFRGGIVMRNLMLITFRCQGLINNQKEKLTSSESWFVLSSITVDQHSSSESPPDDIYCTNKENEILVKFSLR